MKAKTPGEEEVVTLRTLVAEYGGTIRGNEDLEITGVAAPQDARPTEIAPLLHHRWVERCHASRAAVILTSSAFAERLGERTVWIHDTPRLALALLLERFLPEPEVVPLIHPSAVVSSHADIAPSSRVEALAVVEDGAVIGPGTVVGARAVIGENVTIGGDCRIGSGAIVLGPAILGDRVRLGPGSVVGSDGFGFLPGGGIPVRVPQRGWVVIEDDVDIGALTVVDRATLGETRICSGAKIDNLVQVGHSVTVGREAIIAAQSGLAGSAVIGPGAMLGGQVGVADYLEVGAGARLAAKSGVVSDVEPAATVAGYPALPHRLWLRIWASLSRRARHRRGKR